MINKAGGTGAGQARSHPIARALHVRHLHAIILFAVTICLQGACVGERVVFGTIPPSTFQFTTVVEYKGGKAGGWQVAQVIVLLGRLSAMFPRASTCDVEVGVPIVNEEQGFVTIERAQIESALAADHAAYEILKRQERPTASICALFRQTMSYFLADDEVGTIRGARVTAFTNRWVVPRRTFPPKQGRPTP